MRGDVLRKPEFCGCSGDAGYAPNAGRRLSAGSEEARRQATKLLANTGPEPWPILASTEASVFCDSCGRSDSSGHLEASPCATGFEAVELRTICREFA